MSDDVVKAKGRGPYPTQEDWSNEHDGRMLETQTDKEMWKVVPCTYEGCDVDLVVNTFYAPYKGKCERHSGKAPRAIAVSKLTVGGEEAPANGALAKLLCPICQLPMTIKNVSEDGGRITFVCTDGMFSTMKDVGKRKHCMTSVSVKPDYKAMEMTEIPNRFTEVVSNFNIDSKLAYFEIKESRDEQAKP